MKIYETWHCRKLSTIRGDEISWSNEIPRKFREKKKNKKKNKKFEGIFKHARKIKFPKLDDFKKYRYIGNSIEKSEDELKKRKLRKEKEEEEFVPTIEFKTSPNDGD